MWRQAAQAQAGELRAQGSRTPASLAAGGCRSGRGERRQGRTEGEDNPRALPPCVPHLGPGGQKGSQQAPDHAKHQLHWPLGNVPGHIVACTADCYAGKDGIEGDCHQVIKACCSHHQGWYPCTQVTAQARSGQKWLGQWHKSHAAKRACHIIQESVSIGDDWLHQSGAAGHTFVDSPAPALQIKHELDDDCRTHGLQNEAKCEAKHQWHMEDLVCHSARNKCLADAGYQQQPDCNWAHFLEHLSKSARPIEQQVTGTSSRD